MNGGEKVLAIMIAVLVAVIVGLSLKLLHTKEEIGEVEQERNRIHNARIVAYNNEITILRNKISTLRKFNERDERQKEVIIIQTINEIDSVSSLSFDGKAQFFSGAITELDSSRLRYLSDNN